MSLRAFIIRPFSTQKEIDFERVQTELIDPALARLGLEGGTTGLIAEAGNIREDMFQLLLTADVVIADISIHNANVYYELGIRHAFRAQRTYMIRARGDEVPFDLRTDRYLEYDAERPGAALDALVRGLRDTMDSERVDSPVFKLLGTGLVPQDISRFLVPPDDFREEVFRAASEGRAGDLSLLSEEAGRLAWAREGLRRVGNAQFDLASYEPARVTWEAVRGYDADDVEANARLASIYQKLGDLTNADIAVERVLRKEVRGPERAEMQSLRASNMKTRWVAEWREIEDPVKRAEAALASGSLMKAYAEYADAFAADRNHFYSGLNALSLLVILLSLGVRAPHAWNVQFDDDAEAEATRRKLRAEQADLAAAVKLASKSAKKAAAFSGIPNRWLEISAADLACVTGLAPAKVAARYRAALEGAQRFHLAAAGRQLTILERLAVLPEAAAAALAVVREMERVLPGDQGQAAAPARVLLFTGHRLDTAGREQPRFPAAAEEEARGMIEAAVESELRSAGGGVIGIAGGATGGDILFHEVCRKLGIKTQIFVVGSRDAYVAKSVQDGGPGWVGRFQELFTTLPSRVLGNSQDSLDLPRWLRPARGYDVWQRSNRWMLHNALVHGVGKVCLLALWDGEGGDGPGGTQDMVASAQQRGARVVVLDTKRFVVSARD